VTSFQMDTAIQDIRCWLPPELRGDYDSDYEAELKGRGLTLQPTVFHIGVTCALTEYREPGVDYGAWGAGNWLPWQIEKPTDQFAVAMGASKARLLSALVLPANTTELASRLGLTPGTVSRQLQKLGQAGLVASTRVGREVVYRLSERGDQLNQLFS